MASTPSCSYVFPPVAPADSMTADRGASYPSPASPSAASWTSASSASEAGPSTFPGSYASSSSSPPPPSACHPSTAPSPALSDCPDMARLSRPRSRSGEQALSYTAGQKWANWQPQDYRLLPTSTDVPRELGAAARGRAHAKHASSDMTGIYASAMPTAPAMCPSPILPSECVRSASMTSNVTSSSSASTEIDGDIDMDDDDMSDASSVSSCASADMHSAASSCSSTSEAWLPSTERLSAQPLERSSKAHTTVISSASAIQGLLPADCFPASAPSKAAFPPSQWLRRSPGAPCTFPGPTPTDELKATDFESCLRFANADRVIASEAGADSAPPAFFPLQRVSFAPQLKVKTAGGVPLAIPSSRKQSRRDGISGMMLGVTGVIEVLDADKTKRTGKEVVKSQRMIADFATDLTNGLRIWRRDAAPIVREKLRVERQWRTRHNLPCDDLDDPSWDEMLAPGTFMLPLSMKIPCSEKLPPSFESAHYRIRYTMSLAIFGSRRTAEGRPEVLHVHAMPFHILPSTLPTPAPHIPVLTHDTRRAGFFAGLSRALSFSTTSASGKPTDKTCTHIVCPSIPTSSFSPGSVIPITLRIADCPTEPTDLYIRLSLVRKLYVRDAPHPMMNEWGLPEDMYFEEFCKEEEEIVSRWGYVPYAIRAREGATPGSKAQVIISDITLPVGGPHGEWSHGYSSNLDLGPTPCPTMQQGECSWFSPALSARLPVKAEYERYVHASARYFISIEVGFASAGLDSLLADIGDCVPEMELPGPNSFTYPSQPATSAITGLSTTNPFPVSSPSSSRTKRAQAPPFQHAPQLPAFPGKVKELMIPVIIGSVAEPQMACISGRTSGSAASIIPPTPSAPTRAATAEESAERAARDADETDTERYERVGDDGEEPWLCPPPAYSTAVSTVPAYI